MSRRESRSRADRNSRQTVDPPSRGCRDSGTPCWSHGSETAEPRELRALPRGTSRAESPLQMRLPLLRRAIVASFVFAAGTASADSSTPASPTTDPTWLVDGGAVPLFWVPLGAIITIDAAVKPRSTPLFFDPNAGGAAPASWQIPDWTLYVAGAGTAAAFALGHDSARWYHVKGLAESMATSGLVFTVMKDVFGRHRPDWTATSTDPTKDQSFPSGHATEAFAIATYAALYLHDHVFDGHLTLGSGLAYGGIFAAASLVDFERVYHHRHYVSDVVVGSLIGAATSIVMYRYQEHRAHGDQVRSLALAPTLDGRSSVLSYGGAF
jgi:membrane-associated phospholipid phosphatase